VISQSRFDIDRPVVQIDEVCVDTALAGREMVLSLLLNKLTGNGFLIDFHDFEVIEGGSGTRVRAKAHYASYAHYLIARRRMALASGEGLDSVMRCMDEEMQ
jgi:hypothetical protein